MKNKVMSYRQFKKYVKQILSPWEYGDILDNKALCKKECKRLKSKRHLKRKLEEI